MFQETQGRVRPKKRFGFKSSKKREKQVEERLGELKLGEKGEAGEVGEEGALGGVTVSALRGKINLIIPEMSRTVRVREF